MINEFEITSGVIVASDPCYEIPTWCQGIISNVKKGKWFVDVEETSDNRIAKLTITHVQHKYTHDFKPLDFDGGVDSGQFGFFDKDFYRNDESAKDLPKADFGVNYDREEGDQWYRACCKLTLGEEGYGVLPNGAVSSSGYGDGSYEVRGAIDTRDSKLEYVAFEVIFIEERTDDEEDEDDWNDSSFDENEED